MDSKALKPWQARKINEALESLTDYLNRLQARLKAVPLENTERLSALVSEAHRAVHAVRVELVRSAENRNLEDPLKADEEYEHYLISKPSDQTRRGL